MNNKIKNIVLLLTLLFAVSGGGWYYTEQIQKKEINSSKTRISELLANRIDTDILLRKLDSLREKSGKLDLILAKQKYLIPPELKQEYFYRFIDRITSGFSKYSIINIKYTGKESDNNADYYFYELSGNIRFIDFYRLIDNLESGKDFKRITSLEVKDAIANKDDGTPFHLLKFNMKVAVYFAAGNNLWTKTKFRKKFGYSYIYNPFYPLIREDIPPNIDNLPDVQDAQLLALLSDGAYISDSKGKPHLLKEGAKVYLGYLTSIDYKNEEVKFVLNKGGIIEEKILKLGRKETEAIK